jgi:malonyl-ACP O-methyltransferase BioC
MDIKQISRHFSSHAHDYENLAVMQKDIADRLLKLIPERDYLTILDLGCGTGYMCRQLKKRFPAAQVTGVDIASEMLNLAMTEDPEGNYVCGDFTKMDVSGKRYDLIVSASALHWTDGINQILEKYHSLCDMMAYAVFTAPSLESLRQAFLSAYKLAGFPYREHILNFPDAKQLPYVVKSLRYQQDYSSWRDAFKALKAIGGNYTFNYEKPYINRNVLAMLDSLPGARLEWKVVWAVSVIS